jgi:hypothetical protein
VLLDGTYESTWEEGWYMPGSDELTFEEGMLWGTLQAITALLVSLVTASREFAENPIAN